MDTGFKIWKRKPDVGPGHERIHVLTWSDGRPADGIDHVKKGETQCCTISRIPLVLKTRTLLAHYEAE